VGLKDKYISSLETTIALLENLVAMQELHIQDLEKQLVVPEHKMFNGNIHPNDFKIYGNHEHPSA
jgi:hypothetical protein